MKIGIFGGAFNPVHNGHLHLAEMLVRSNNIDKLLVIPTSNPPHRLYEELIDGEHRINMLQIAFNDKNNFETDISSRVEVSDIEFHLKGKSYTYNTIKKIKKQYPKSELYLFMGTDQFLSFKKWYKYKGILKRASVIGFARNKNDREILRAFLQENQKDFLYNAGVMYAAPFEVSSTEIRERIKNGKSVADMIPAAVEEYIKVHGLYV